MTRKRADSRARWHRKSRLGRVFVGGLSLLLAYSLFPPRLANTLVQVWLLDERPSLGKEGSGSMTEGSNDSLLSFGLNGRVHGWEVGEGVHKGRHPIEVLIARGEERWRDLLGRQSRGLDEAVNEYQHRYGRAPPKGFDMWWSFCEENNVRIRDDYDQIDRDVSPYFALLPETFRARAERLFETEHSYHIHLSNTTTSISGDQAHSKRGRLLHDLLIPLARLLPLNLTIHISDHDLGSWILADDQRRLLNQAIRDGRYVSEDELKPYEKREGRVKVKGLVSACPEDTAGWKIGLDKLEGREPHISEPAMTFIYDPRLTNDFCTSPSLLHSHGAFSFDHPRQSTLRPIFQLSKFSRNPEFLTPPLEAYHNLTDVGGRVGYVSWKDKTVDKLFWRGRTTGDAYSIRQNWRKSHRTKLGLMTQITANDIVVENLNDSLIETTGPSDDRLEVWVDRGDQWKSEEWSLGQLNDRYMDVGLIGGPHQCNRDDGTCDEMEREIRWKDQVRPEDATKFKYVLDVDGNGWSSRFHRLLTSGSVVVKATIYPEWNSDWLIPWYHYVPASVDYSDLYSIMSFFVGPPETPTSGFAVPERGHYPFTENQEDDQLDVVEEHHGAIWRLRRGHQDYFGVSDQGTDPAQAVRKAGHDHLAQRIAENGRAFGEQFWRWEDMQAYMLRLLLEYARLQADDREAWSYRV